MFCCHHQQAALGEVMMQDRRLLKFASYSAFLISFLLVICRLAAYFTSHSLAIEASVADAVKDCLVSTVNALLVLQSIRPANNRFPFGSGKVEALAAFMQAAFLFVTGGWILFESIRESASHHHHIDYSTTALVSLVISIALGITLACIQGYVARRTKSMAFLAESAHYRSDVMMNVGVLCCFLLAVKSALIDLLVGVAMAIYLLIMAWTVGRNALVTLLDCSLPDATLRHLEDLIVAAGGEIAALKTHGTGRGEFISLQLRATPSQSVKQLMKLQEAIETRIHTEFPRSFVIVGLVLEAPENAEH